MTPATPRPTPRPTPRHRAAAFGSLAAILLSGCSSGSDRASTCAKLPDYDTKCSTRNSRYEPDWKEAGTPLPPVPQDGDLVPVDAPLVGGAYDVFVDRKSVLRGADGVMRYAVVVRSRSGARNVFYEGLRCLTDEVRTYAFATHDETFQRATGEAWSRLADSGPRAYQDYLAHVIMCDRNGYAWDAEKAVRALERQYTAGGVRIKAACKDQSHCGPYNRQD